MDVIEAILNRKSIRYFKPYTIPRDDLTLMLECARFAPSAGNRQPWEFLVVDDPVEISEIYEYGWTAYGGGTNVCRFADASLLFFFIGGPQCYLPAENLCLAAHTLGYGSCMIGGFAREETKTLLGIPEGKTIQLFVVVGRADEERSNDARFTASGKSLAEVLPHPPECRRPLNEVVHRGRHGSLYTELGQGRSRDRVVGVFK
jgi:nitroreductase